MFLHLVESNERKICTIESEILLVWGLNSIARCFKKVGGSGENGCGKHSMQILWSLNIIAELKKTRVGFVWVRCFACAPQSPDSIAKCKKPSHKSGFNKGLEGGREGGHQMGVESSVWILQSSYIISILKGSTPNATVKCLPFPTTTPINNPPSQILTCFYCRRHIDPSLSAFWCPICNQKNN